MQGEGAYSYYYLLFYGQFSYLFQCLQFTLPISLSFFRIHMAPLRYIYKQRCETIVQKTDCLRTHQKHIQQVK